MKSKIPRSSLAAALTLGMVSAFGAGQALPAATEEEKPNFLIIIADDATYLDLPAYGGDQVQTPRIERLASEGLTFDRAYLSEAMCLPCRSALFTGLYPVRNGAAWNHSQVRPDTRSIVHHLRDLDYRVGIAGKIHVRPREAFPFEKVPGVTRGSVAPVAEFDPKGVREFIEREDDRPFCLVIGFNSPHGPWTVGDADRFDPAELELPPYLVDTEPTRRAYAKYLAEIEVLDRQVGKALDLLKKGERAEETLVLFTSEQGSAFPGAKWTNWNPGVHTALIARWPGTIEPGRRTDALVQYVDVLPTLLDVAGGDPAQHDFDGRSFLPVLTGKRDRHRDYAYFMHNNVPEGPPYPVRGVTDGKYHYVRNLTPDAVYIEKHQFSGDFAHTYWRSWMHRAATNDRAARLVNRYMRRPAEELYYIRDDPHNMQDVAGASEHADARKRLSKQLDAWMGRQGDPGAALDTPQQWRKSRKGEHFTSQTSASP